MLVSEISLWGAALVACLVFVAMIALAFADSKMLRRMLVIFGATVAHNRCPVINIIHLRCQRVSWRGSA